MHCFCQARTGPHLSCCVLVSYAGPFHSACSGALCVRPGQVLTCLFCVLAFLRPLSLSLLRGLVCVCFALAHPVGLFTLLVQGPSLSVSIALTLCQESWQQHLLGPMLHADALVRTSCCSSLVIVCACFSQAPFTQVFALAHPVGLLTLLVQGPSLSVSLDLTPCQEPWQFTASSWAHAADALVRTSCCSSLNCHCVCACFSQAPLTQLFALAHPVGLLTLLVQGPSLSVSLALTLCQEPRLGS